MSGPSSADRRAPLAIVPVAALATLLRNREADRGSPLTKGEVPAIRDAAVCIALPASVAASMADRRGYDDIDPERAWQDRQAIRETLARGSNEEAA